MLELNGEHSQIGLCLLNIIGSLNFFFFFNSNIRVLLSFLDGFPDIVVPFVGYVLLFQINILL